MVKNDSSRGVQVQQTRLFVVRPKPREMKKSESFAPGVHSVGGGFVSGAVGLSQGLKVGKSGVERDLQRKHGNSG